MTNKKPVAWMLKDDGDTFFSAVDHSFNNKWMPLYTHPAKTLIVSKDDVANLVSSGEYWTLDDHLNIVSVHFDKFAEAILRKANEK